MKPLPAEPSLAVVIPALNAGAHLAATLEPLCEGAGAFDMDVLVVDGGSDDDTVAVAEAGGARVVTSPRGRGTQLAAGAVEARGDWILFLHADTVLATRWARELAAFMESGDARAAYFRFRLDDDAPGARRIERLVAWRCRVLGLPYGDQGLALSRELYLETGGYPDQPLMEDVHLVRRLGRGQLEGLQGAATTSAERYRAGGYWRRPVRNLFCLALYLLGASPRFVARLYR
ncbi:MAG: TIGR04283 family arsenosugar biosynthesis glycosyltransferase [Alphaproteobacteria bacterium]